jgi:hypothetical protein
MLRDESRHFLADRAIVVCSVAFSVDPEIWYR